MITKQINGGKRVARIFLLFFASTLLLSAVHAQTRLTTTQAKNLYKDDAGKKRVAVHDPSIVYEPVSKVYYIFGSHRDCARSSNLRSWNTFSSPWATAVSNNAANNQAFTTPEVTTVKKNGQDVSLPAFNAMEWAARTDEGYDINGNMWAPDVIYNPTMQKWCQYLSINGDEWHSSIILLTADKITGPYRYQAPVVIGGFYDAAHSYKDTDLELVIGTQASLPSRYATGKKWGNRYPNNIDPCVFYDEEGKLWMVYGSWSGGIWMLELDKTTGLRDYDVVYKQVGSGDDITTDPYFGKKIAGGHYVSGEAPYIEYVNGYYYLFVTYGFLDSTGGYVMRLFRSKQPDGPYTDAAGRNAVFTSYVMNYGKNADKRGVKVLGAYDHWGFMSQGDGTKEGELSQGHNSIIAAPDGRTYLVYHTRFNNGTEWHQVRVHQMFQTKNNWLVAAPFEYNGDTLTDASIASRQLFTAEEIAGTYQLLVHKYDMDYANREVVEPVQVRLDANGTISGAYSGTWSLEEGTSYITVKLSGVPYNGVLIQQQMDFKTIKTIAFSALSTTGVNIWGYKMMPQYALAWQVNNQTIPVKSYMAVEEDLNLDGMWLGDPNVSLQWSSSRPDIIDEHGHYTPKGLKNDTYVDLTARLSVTGYYWEQSITVKALADPDASAVGEVHSASDRNDGICYDLGGLRIDDKRPHKGVCIRNKKKIFIH
ncbi:MAG: glycoside hydrolase family 43 protein [Prevotella sp.]|nr:glycoside hydrolase family 43 protein [Prevotella sp.]